MMTVKELIALLGTFPPDATVVQAKDAEGNGFSPTWMVAAGNYVPDSTYSGEFEGAVAVGEAPNAVCLWPTN